MVGVNCCAGNVKLSKEERRKVILNYLKEYRQNPINKEIHKKYQKRLYHKQKELWNSLNDNEQVEILQNKALDILRNLK